MGADGKPDGEFTQIEKFALR